MNGDHLEALATDAGLQRRWTDASGQDQTVDADDLRVLLDALGWPCASEDDIRDSRHRLRAAQACVPPLITTTSQQPELPPALPGEMVCIAWEHGGSFELHRHRDGAWPPLPANTPPGYHRLQHVDGEVTLAVAPPRCFGIDDLPDTPKRVWGLVAQIYALRGRDDAGFGDFESLARCAELAAAAGAGALAISPTHAMFQADPDHYGPYSPSSRQCLNVLYIDPHMAFSDADIDAARVAIGDTGDPGPATELIDWPAASGRKLALLRQLHAMRQARQPCAPPHYDPNDPWHVHACFEALHAHVSRHAGHVLDLPDWPLALAWPGAPEVIEFAHAHVAELGFHLWLQHLANQCLAQVQAQAHAGGMSLGLIADLAVGSDPGGSDAWSMRAQMFDGISLGAPPDAFNPDGQSWGLTTFAPQPLRESGFAPWLRVLRATLRNVGGIRIDHAMGLARLWLVPDGCKATHGAYVHMPADDLLRLLALESWRHRAVVIGEDLGTIGTSLRRRLRDSGLLGMSALWFERDDEACLPPLRWPSDAVAMSGTHDLPTLAGWWSGRDLEWQARVHDTDPTAMKRMQQQRQHDRADLWQSLHVHSLKTDPIAVDADTVAPMKPPPAQQPAPFVDAACAALASAPAPLLLVPMEDLVADTEQVNLPGVTEQHPNWRRRHTSCVDAVFARPDVRHRLDLLARRPP